jgi:hypothetical protein
MFLEFQKSVCLACRGDLMVQFDSRALIQDYFLSDLHK